MAGDASVSTRVVVLYGVFYGISSASMLMGNKLAFYYFPFPALVCSVQYAFTVAVCLILHAASLAKIELSLAIVKAYWKVPALFALAIWSNGQLLKNANVETFIVCRNTTPILVALADFLVMGKDLPSRRSVVAFFLIILGAVYYTITDSEFSLKSYSWALVYLTAIVVEMIYVKHIFNSVDMSTWSRVMYNNLLALPFQPIFAIAEYTQYRLIITGELEGGGITTHSLFFLFLSCIGGLSIAFAGTAFRNLVSATTFTTVGVANKIITVTINYVIWDKHANGSGLIGLSACLFGSMLYQPAQKRTDGNFSDRVYKSMCGSPASHETHPAEIDALLESGDSSKDKKGEAIAEMAVFKNNINNEYRQAKGHCESQINK